MTISAHRRKVLSIALGSCLLVLFAGLATLNAFKLTFLNPATVEQVVVFSGLSAVAFLTISVGLVVA